MLLGQLRRHGDADSTATHGLPPGVVFTMLRYLTFEERVFLAMCSRLALVLLPHASYFERPVDCPTDGLYVGPSWKGNIVRLVSAISGTIIGRHNPVHELQLLSVQLEPQHVLALANAIGPPSVTTNPTPAATTTFHTAAPFTFSIATATPGCSCDPDCRQSRSVKIWPSWHGDHAPDTHTCRRLGR